MIHGANIPALSDACCTRAVFLMRQFDRNQAGRLNLEEFTELMRELEKRRGGFFTRLCKRRRDSTLSDATLRERLSNAESADGTERVWRTYTADEADANGECTGSRMFTSFFSGAQLSDSTVNLIRYATNSDSYAQTRLVRDPSASRLSNAASSAGAMRAAGAACDAATGDDMTLEAVPLPELDEGMLGELDTDEGRRRFLDWLFIAADWDHNGEVSITELGTVLDALAEDGIPAQALTYFVDTGAARGGSANAGSAGAGGADVVAAAAAAATPASASGRTGASVAASIIADFDWDVDGSLGAEEFREFGAVLANELLSHRDWLGKSVRRVGPYVLSRTIGYGGEGLVKHAVHTRTQRTVALKIVPRGVLSQLSRVDAEIEALHTLRRAPTVLDIVEVFESSEYVFLALELCGGGTLHDFIRSSARAITEDVARFFFVAVCRALADAHSAGVVHRDVRVENVLLSNGGMAKLGDWGHSARFRQGWDLFNDQPGTVGALHSASPEMLRPGPYSGVKADAWGLGVILFCLLTRQRPFRGNTCDEVLANIERYDTAPVPSSVSTEARMLLAQLMHPDPAARITPEEALASPWVRSGRMLKPAIALGAITIPPTACVCPPGVDPDDAREVYRGVWADVCAVLRAPRDIRLAFGAAADQVPTGRVMRLRGPGGGALTTLPAAAPIEGGPAPPSAAAPAPSTETSGPALPPSDTFSPASVNPTSILAHDCADAPFAVVANELTDTAAIVHSLTARLDRAGITTRFSVCLTDDGVVRFALTGGTTWDFRRLFLRMRHQLLELWEDTGSTGEVDLLTVEVGGPIAAELQHLTS